MSISIKSVHNSNDTSNGNTNRKKNSSHPALALLHQDNPTTNNGTMDQIDRTKNKLGTIPGCYVPCLLNIMGIILFLRLAWGIGHLGIGGVLLCFLISESQCVITVLSLCAIVTNGAMRAGGPYYMISRTMGPEFGGSIGILFYGAYCVCVAFYAAGFAEIIASTWFERDYWILTAFSSMVMFYCLIVALIGANCFTKINVILFAIQFTAIFIALIAMFGRGTFPLEGQSSPCKTNGEPDGDYTHYKWTIERMASMWDFECESCVSFAFAFGVLFPATTGIMEGANLSGDLANPGYSIPVGTLGAIFTSIFFYLLLIVAFAGSSSACTLREDNTIMQEVAWGDVGTYLVVTGIIISASSSTLGSLFSGSRILQAIARDKLFPYTSVFEYGSPQGDEPRTCVLMTWFIAQGLVFVGGINVIAPISTAIFCLSYAIINISCFLLSVSGTPNFRPSFKYYSWHMSLFGAVANFAIMFYVDWIFGCAALVVEVAIFAYLTYTQPQPDAVWGDVTQSLMFHQVRKYLLRLDERKKHSKSWRPSILLLADSKYNAAIDFCNNLKKGGLYIIGVAVNGEYGEFDKTTTIRKQWIEFIDHNGLKAFPQITVAPDIRNAMENLVLLSGLGALQPNTVMLPLIRIMKQRKLKRRDIGEEKEEEYEDEDEGDTVVSIHSPLVPESPASMDANEYTKLLRNILRFSKNLIITANFGAFDDSLITSLHRDEASKSFIDEMEAARKHIQSRKRRTMGSEAFLSDSISHSFIGSFTVLKTGIQTREEAQWIDVWLRASDYTFNARNIANNKCDDTFPMLIMQLSHILMRNKVWKRNAKVKLRVLMMVDNGWSHSDKLNFDEICKALRLNIEEFVEVEEPGGKHTKVEWESIVNGTKKSSSLKKYYHSLNNTIRSYSNHSYFTFIQLPQFPSLNREKENDEMNAKLNMLYYQSLYVLLRGLPPTALCQTGEIEPVISVNI